MNSKHFSHRKRWSIYPDWSEPNAEYIDNLFLKKLFWEKQFFEEKKTFLKCDATLHKQLWYV